MASPEPAPALLVHQLSHRFKKHQALSNVSFSVARQSIHGFVGPNGAGKTTTLKVLATLLPPQSGRVEVCGRNVVRDAIAVRQSIGFMPDHFSMYRQMTVLEYLDFFAAAYGLGGQQRDKVVQDVLAITDMTGRQSDLVKGLSRGMQQRVGLARVLVNDPQVLLLDEPASGLDPRARIELMEILQELRRLGKTIFISSHILTELAQLCDSVTIIDRGTIKYTGAMNALLRRQGEHLAYLLSIEGEHDGVDGALATLPGVTANRSDTPGVYRVSIDPAQASTALVLRCVLDRGLAVHELKQDTRHLNEAFMDLTEPGIRESKS
jgi:ABC-2 type transport system ATP-binding protein